MRVALPPQALLLLAATTAGCLGGGTADAPATTDVAAGTAFFVANSDWPPLDYSKTLSWACSPERSNDVCDRSLEGARLLTDGTALPVTVAPAAQPAADCFYVYPTIDWRLSVTNTVDLALPLFQDNAVKAQAVPLGGACRVIAPYYRQASLGSYGVVTDNALLVFRRAAADVAAAFDHYLTHWNQGRPIVMVGHSQGAQMVEYLLHAYFDAPPTDTTIVAATDVTRGELRARLALALPIGFNVYTPADARTGGTFAHLPLCADDDTPGCVIHYRTFVDGSAAINVAAGGNGVDQALAREGYLYRPSREGDVLACVNPGRNKLAAGDTATGNFGDPIELSGARVLREAVFAGLIAEFTLDLPLDANPVLLPRIHTAACRSDRSGDGFLGLGRYFAAGTNDTRTEPIGLDELQAATPLGLHLYDMSVAMGDLAAQIRARTAAWLRAR